MVEKTSIVIADSIIKELDYLTESKRNFLGFKKPSTLELMGIKKSEGYEIEAIYFPPIMPGSGEEQALSLYDRITASNPSILVVNPWHVGGGYRPYSTFIRRLARGVRQERRTIIANTDSYLQNPEWEQDFDGTGIIPVKHSDIDSLVNEIIKAKKIVNFSDFSSKN